MDIFTEILQDTGRCGDTVDWATMEELDEMLKSLEEWETEDRLTDLCTYEPISSGEEEAEEDEGKNTPSVINSRSPPNGNFASVSNFPFDRTVTIQTGRGEPSRKRTRRSSRWDDLPPTPPAEVDSVVGAADQETGLEQTVVEPVQEFDPDLDNVVQKLEQNENEQTVVEPVDANDPDLENVVQKLEQAEFNTINQNEQTVVEPVEKKDEDLANVLEKLEQAENAGGQRALREQIDDFPDTFFEVTLKKTRSFKHKKADIVNEYSYQVNLRDEAVVEGQTLGNILPQMHVMFSSILQEIKNSHSPSDLVRIFITHQDVVAVNIIVGPDFLDKITADSIINHLTDVIHSNNFIPANKGLSINVTAIKNISGLNTLNVTNVFRDLQRKGCIISIDNQDNLCLPRAIAVGLARADHLMDPENSAAKTRYENMRRRDRGTSSYGGRMSLQKKVAVQLMRRAGIPDGQDGLLSDVPLYESVTKTGITVISARSGNKKVYNGNRAHRNQIILYHSEDGAAKGHFSVLTKVSPLLNKSYYCDTCDVGFNSRTKHRCKTWCNICGHSACLLDGESQTCPACCAPCRSADCLRRHREKKSEKWPSLCEQMSFCPDCGVALCHPNRSPKRDRRHHVCGENYCTNCQVYYWQDHKCFMRSTPAARESGVPMESKRFIFYDFESMLTRDGDHVPNLVVAHSICYMCQDVTHVGREDKCAFCGSRCGACSNWNRKEKQFEKDPCDDCGHRLTTFRGRDTVDRFCSWLISEQHTGVRAVAHNARAYDSYFIYHYIVSNGMKPSIIFRGAKIINLHIQNRLNIRFLDSLNYLSMPLSQLPKSFGLRELKKGFFPHLYNTEATLEEEELLKLSRHPPMEYFDPDSMSDGRRSEFLRWYEKNGHKEFDFYKELQDYCQSDVDILLNACWKFRQLVNQVTGPDNPIDAFDYLTMPSLCMGIFRTKFLPEKWSVLFEGAARAGCCHEWNCTCPWTPARKVNGDCPLETQDGTGSWVALNEAGVVKKAFSSSPICLIPRHGYGRRDNYSVEAMGFILWFEKCYREEHGLKDFKIQHAMTSGGEKTVVHGVRGPKQQRFKFDGYFTGVDGRENVVEFYGCWFHGCPACYPRDRDRLMIMNKTMNRRHAETLERARKIREMGYTLHEMWSCDFSLMSNMYGDLGDFLRDLDLPKTIDAREAYFGGRTNAIKLHQTFTRDFPGCYFDFCSLYPDVLKYNRYPIGHPDRMTDAFPAPVSYPCTGNCPYHPCRGTHVYLPYFGLMKLRILPPRNLLFPVLPLKINGKLMFPLCNKCAREENVTSCQCTQTERTLLNTWCTPEVEAAINMGYDIVQIYEILHWPETEMIDRETGQGGLFSGYINCFLRLKAEASGYPPGVESEEDRRAYIDQYLQHEGVQLDPDRIQANPGLRSLAKLALNSFYGKFGQRENMKKCSFLTQAEDIYRYMTDYSKHISDFHLLSDNMLAIEYSVAPEFTRPDPKTNVVIAAFCTSYARLKLWRELNLLGTRVVYHDTDSVVFKHDPSAYNPSLGAFLGQLTDELTCKGVGCKGCPDGHWIQEFVSCGAKNYAYKLNSGEVVCKVRGFSLNYSASKIVNLDSMRECLRCWNRGEEAPELVTVKTMILRKKMEGVVYSQEMPKTYGMVYNKRILLDDYFTLPYGYRE